MKCGICGGKLGINKVNPDFYECELCKTLVRIDSHQMDQAFYNTNYFQDKDEMVRTLNLNSEHYKKLFEMVANNPKYIEIKNDIFKNKLDTVYCFGGGFPHFESFLPVEHIRVYDFAADQYRDNLNLFSEYCSDKTIEYTVYDASGGVIDLTQPSIVTFSHILEHFTIESITNIFKSISEHVALGSYVLIYQPNPVMATRPTWLHWTYHSKEHITFLPINTFTKFINSFPNLSVKLSVPYSDDLLIIAKVE